MVRFYYTGVKLRQNKIIGLVFLLLGGIVTCGHCSTGIGKASLLSENQHDANPSNLQNPFLNAANGRSNMLPVCTLLVRPAGINPFFHGPLLLSLNSCGS
jgi:hypothetical protein